MCLAAASCMQVSTLLLAALAAASLGALTAMQTAPRSSLACYEAATEQTSLDQRRALRLCQGADTTWPVQCFEAATDRTSLSDRRAIRLCQCAESLRAVACYERADDETDLLALEIVRMCNARALNEVELPYCTPVERGLVGSG